MVCSLLHMLLSLMRQQKIPEQLGSLPQWHQIRRSGRYMYIEEILLSDVLRILIIAGLWHVATALANLVTGYILQVVA